MRSAAAGHRGFFHEAAFYGSDAEFLAIVVPFLTGGVEAREPTLVAMPERTAELIRVALGDTPKVVFQDAQLLRPASALRAFRELLSAYVAHGAQQIRLAGEVPHPGTGHPWEWWARFEATINYALGEFPLWGLCPYDTRITPTEVLADVARTHPYLATTDGWHVANARFEDPAEFLASRPAARVDPLESAPPMIELVDPAPAGARRAVRNAGRASRLDTTEVADFVYAVNEAVTNAVCHGLPPVRLRLWSSPDRIVATVTDRGLGPADPFAGLLPSPIAGLLPSPSTASAGVGLWLTYQICSHVTLGRDDDGFTIRLIAGSPSLAA